MSDETSEKNTQILEQINLDSKQTPSPEKRAFLEVNETKKYKPFMLNQLETKRFKPSSALSKVRDFLPILKQSTDKLLEDFKENPDQVNIENVDEEDEHIEMNLALVAQSDSDEDDDDDDDESEEEEQDEDDSSSNSLDDLELGIKVKDPTKIKKLKLSSKQTSKSKGLIQVLNDNEQNTTENEESSPKNDE